MKNVRLLLVVLLMTVLINGVNSRVVSSGEGSYILSVDPSEVTSGCIEYLGDTEVHPKVECSIGWGYTCNISYTFDFTIPNVDAQTSEKAYLIFGNGYPMTSKDSLFWSRWEWRDVHRNHVYVNGYYFYCRSDWCKFSLIPPDTYLNIPGTNHFLTYISTYPSRFSDIPSDPEKISQHEVERRTRDLLTLASFKLCMFYPDLEIVLDSDLPSTVTNKDVIYVEGRVINKDQIDAKRVRITLESSDFKVTPRDFEVDISGNYDSDDSVKKFKFKLTPPSHRTDEYELYGINYGTVKVSFKDDTGETRTTELDLGKANFEIENEEDAEHVTLPYNEETPYEDNYESTETEEYTESSSTQDFWSIAGPVVAVVVIAGIAFGIFYIMKKKRSGDDWDTFDKEEKKERKREEFDEW